MGSTDVTEETWRRVVSNGTQTNAEMLTVKPVNADLALVIAALTEEGLS